MGFRTIVIKSRAKLDFSINYLVCRSEKEKRIQGIDDLRLNSYISEVKVGDKTNREGHSAKVYFNLLGCSGRRVDSEFNSALNYGYAVLLAMFCRSITTNGLITQLGIWHRNEFNPYNLASDMMETYRVIVDDLALNIKGEKVNFKYQMANLSNCKVFIDNKWLYMESGIDIYVKSLINALNCKNVRLIKNFTKYELSIYENTGNV